MTTGKLPREIYNLFNGRTFHNFTHLKGDFTMNNNEIMNNEVVEATEEVIENAGLSKETPCLNPQYPSLLFRTTK